MKDILDLQRGGAQPCGRVIELLEARLGEIDATVADLVALRSTLAAALDSARSSSRRGEPGVVCRIIEPPAATPPT